MEQRMEKAEKLFHEGYNCSQSVFAAFSDLYGIDEETALKLSASFGGGMGRMREVCGAVSGMFMLAGLETGSAKKMDAAGKKYNYDIVQKLAKEFREKNGSIICRELLSLEKEEAAKTNTSPDTRNAQYYQKRPCGLLVKDAAEIVENVLLKVNLEPVNTKEQVRDVAYLADNIWHEYYSSILNKDQIDYMIDQFQSESAITEQIEKNRYHYFLLKNLGGIAGYFAYQIEKDKLFLSKFYIDKKYRGRGYARQVLDFMENTCRENKLNKIWLTVNKYNKSSIKAYESLGFETKKAQISDIGLGYVMDDYVMEKSI